MYRHCIFCKSRFGRNQTIESFPVGRRLAFDGAKGRLWVVCSRCKRWNLSALEERWEAIEACERLYRDTRKRVTTEHIGLARLADGTDIVRIGRPQRPEFAAWRYGETLLRRRRQNWIAGAGTAAFGVTLAFGSSAILGVGIGFTAWIPKGLSVINQHRAVVLLPGNGGESFPASRAQLRQSSFHKGSRRWLLRVPLTNCDLEYPSDAALKVAVQIMPHVNRDGADRTEVGMAVKDIELHRSVEHYIEQTILRLSDLKHVSAQPQLFNVPNSVRLALEMAVHEEQERRALEGELAELESLWREAEEIANISDNLLLPRSVVEFLKRQKGRSDA